MTIKFRMYIYYTNSVYNFITNQVYADRQNLSLTFQQLFEIGGSGIITLIFLFLKKFIDI